MTNTLLLREFDRDVAVTCVKRRLETECRV